MNELLPGITIFTPTYNRAHTLKRLYDSLLLQDPQMLEWLIVDDGSTDDTAELVRGFAAQAQVQVRYLYKENGGKHTALNVGIQNAARQYFLCVDSDDCLAEGALERILDCVRRRSPKGIIAYKSRLDSGEVIGDPFPEGLEQTTLFSLINDHRSSGDRTLIYQTALLRGITIPEPEGMTFFPETYLYDRFDQQHRCVLLPEVLCRCEYLAGGYSDSFRMLMIRNALPMKWFYAERIDMPSSFSVRYGSVFRYVAFSLLAPGKTGRYRGKYWYLLPLGFPKGFAMFLVYGYFRLRDRRKRK